MPQSTVIGLIEIDGADADFDAHVDVLRRDPRSARSSRLDETAVSLFQFAVPKTERLDADLVRLAIDLDHEYRRIRDFLSEAGWTSQASS